jgi:hypothetical protein
MMLVIRTIRSVSCAVAVLNTNFEESQVLLGPGRVEATRFKTLYIVMLCFGGVIVLASGLTLGFHYRDYISKVHIKCPEWQIKSRKQEGKNIVPKQEVSGLNSLWGSSGLYDPAHTKVSGKKISIQQSTRIQESIPEDQYFAAFTIVGDMIQAGGPSSADTSHTAHSSSEIEARLFEADMEEEEPALLPVSHSYTSEMLSGSVGRFGTGMKPLFRSRTPQSVRPTASEAAASLVWNAKDESGKVETMVLSADLVVLSPHELDDIVMEEDEPEEENIVSSSEENTVSLTADLVLISLHVDGEESVMTGPLRADGVVLSPHEAVDLEEEEPVCRAVQDEDDWPVQRSCEEMVKKENLHEHKKSEEKKNERAAVPFDTALVLQKNDFTVGKAATKKRIFFNTSFFSSSKQKTVEKEPLLSEQPDFMTSEAGSFQSIGRDSLLVGTPVNQQTLLLLPPLIGGIRDEGEFEEDEPGKIVVRVCMYDKSMYVCMYSVDDL